METLIVLLILPLVYAFEAFVVYWLTLLVTYSAKPRTRKILISICTYPGIIGNAYSMLPLPLPGWALNLIFANANLVWIPLPFVFPTDSALEAIIFIAVELLVIWGWFLLLKHWFKKLDEHWANQQPKPTP